MRPYVQTIFDRHVAALRGVTAAGGTWLDDGAARLSLWLALEELDSHHLSINPATNGNMARLQHMEERLLTLLDTHGADGEYAGDPVAAVERMLEERNDVIMRMADAADGQQARMADLHAEIARLRMAGAITASNGNGSEHPAEEHPAPVATLPRTHINWSGLPAALQATVSNLQVGSATWRTLSQPDRRAITLYALPRAGSPTMSLAEWQACRPAWMPTGSALASIFGLRWSELLAQAYRVAVDDGGAS